MARCVMTIACPERDERPTFWYDDEVEPEQNAYLLKD